MFPSAQLLKDKNCLTDKIVIFKGEFERIS